jgi:hypothetical protein
MLYKNENTNMSIIKLMICDYCESPIDKGDQFVYLHHTCEVKLAKISWLVMNILRRSILHMEQNIPNFKGSDLDKAIEENKIRELLE